MEGARALACAPHSSKQNKLPPTCNLSQHLQCLALLPLRRQLRQQLLIASLSLHALGTRRRRHLIRLPLRGGEGEGRGSVWV